jgi:hypothetical protein
VGAIGFKHGDFLSERLLRKLGKYARQKRQAKATSGKTNILLQQRRRSVLRGTETRLPADQIQVLYMI